MTPEEQGSATLPAQMGSGSTPRQLDPPKISSQPDGLLQDARLPVAEVKTQPNDIDKGLVRSWDYFTLGLPVLVRAEDARRYPRSIKHLITGLVAACSLAIPLGSNILLPVLAPAARDLGTTKTVVNLSIAFYCLAVGIAPLWWTTLSECQGSRRTYIATLILFTASNIVAAESVSAAMFIAMRLLAGAALAPAQALGAATVADLWELRERGQAMGIFLLGAMIGNVIGPTAGGALGSRWGWRCTQWLMAIYGAVVSLLVFILLPEIRSRPKASETDCSESNLRRDTVAPLARFLGSVSTTFVKPLKLLPLLRFPPILITVCYMSIAFAAYYFVILSIQTTFSSSPYSYSIIVVGLLYLPNAAGNIIAVTLGARWTDRVMAHAAAAAGHYDEQHRLKPKPHDMLGPNIWAAGLLFPTAILVSGWASDRHITALPLIANFFFALGNMMVQNITTVLLTEFTPGQPAAGVALANLVRNSLGAIVCVITQPLVDCVGIGWLSTIVAVICGLSAMCIGPLQRKASAWAEAMVGRP